MFAGYDVIVDGTDNFPTRYLVNDACVLVGKPNVYGSIFRLRWPGHLFLSTIRSCYRLPLSRTPAARSRT